MKQMWFIHIVFSCVTTQIVAQLRLDQVPLSPIKSNTGIFVYGADNLKREIPYSTINGTPFWNSDFMDAMIYLTDGRSYGPCAVKLNLASNDVNFLNGSGEELTAQPGIINKIVFHAPGNPTFIITVFRNDIDLINVYPKYKNYYVQELNQGDVQLLRLSRKSINETDSLFGTKKRYSFVLEQAYFLRMNSRIYFLRKLHGTEIRPILRLSNDQQNWIATNSLNLSREKDVLATLDYLNKQKK
jgi:hypothetical protein